MARFVVPFDFVKVFEARTIDIEADTAGEFLAEIRKRAGREAWSRLSRAVMLVNGVALSRLSGMKTPLSESDEVWLVFPAGGG